MQIIPAFLKRIYHPPLTQKIFLTSILENNVSILTVNPAFKIQFANTISEALLKTSNKKILGIEIQQIFENPQTFEKIKNEITNSENDDYTCPEQNLKTLDGSNTKIPVKITIKKIRNVGANYHSPKKNQLLGLIFIFKDISEIKNYSATLKEKIKEIEEKDSSIQKLLEELAAEKSASVEKIKQETLKITKEHNHLLSAINSLNLPFLITDKYKNIIYNNNTALTIFPSLKNQQTTIQELQNTASINYDLNGQIDRCLKEKIFIKLPDIQINLNFVNIFISPIILDAQNSPDPIGTSIIIRDKTEQYNLEKSKEDIFAITFHELRAPLTAIYGYVSLIKQIYFNNIQDAQLKNSINNIGVLCKKLSMSINNFLDSSRLEQNKIQLKNEQCNLSAIINENIKIMEKIALDKNLYIKFDPPLFPIMVQGDQARLAQIINILINNAIKFTQIGGIYIRLDQQKDFTKLSIQDTGLGISEENKHMLFGKFQQAGNNNALITWEGIGLGLYIAKLLIEKMGGKIQLEKTGINKGSTFSFTIPSK
jgi:signal transduction histidine kinase